MSKNIITKKRRIKLAEASHTTGSMHKITKIALGDGGVDGNGNVIDPLAENVQLMHELIRKDCSSTKVDDTTYAYSIFLSQTELVGKNISELALIDSAGDVAVFSNFLSKGKDDSEVIFTINDSY